VPAFASVVPPLLPRISTSPLSSSASHPAAPLAVGDIVLLYVLMERVALPRIALIHTEYRKYVDDDHAEAQRFKDQSDAVMAAYEQAIAEPALTSRARQIIVITGNLPR